jgi:class 3 adenylate cyclase
VHLASRILDKAGDGEILVSNTVKDLVVGSGIEFIQRGEASLKGIPGTWQLFAVGETAAS